MDFGSNTFLIITIAMFLIAVFAIVQGLIPIGVVFALFVTTAAYSFALIVFALFGVGGLLVRYTVKKKK